jgi:hypothetical protein
MTPALGPKSVVTRRQRHARKQTASDLRQFVKFLLQRGSHPQKTLCVVRNSRVLHVSLAAGLLVPSRMWWKRMVA